MFDEEENSLVNQRFKQIYKRHYTRDIFYCIKVRPVLKMFLAYELNNIKIEAKNDHTVDQFW